MTPGRVADILGDNAAILEDLRALTVAGFSGADAILGWDTSAGAAIGYTLGAGLSHAGTEINVADAMAGAGLTIASSIFAVGAGNGITVNANDVAITDVAAGAAQPVAITSGTFSFDLSSITTLAPTGVAQAADGIVMSDAGTVKVMPWDKMGLPVVSTAANDNLNDDDTKFSTIARNTGTGIVWTIVPDATYDAEIGSFILLANHHASASLTITAGTGVTLMSIHNPSGTTAQSDVVIAGGSAVLYKYAADSWQLVGNTSDA